MKLILLILIAIAEALVYPSQYRCVQVSTRHVLHLTREEGETNPIVFEESLGEESADERLRKDIARFRQESTITSEEEIESKTNPLISVINIFGAILSVNFVIIVGLFLYFLYGVFSLYALKNEAPILSVQANFDPFILPILSTHMGLTFLSAGLERVAGINDD
mmetsp:Transcript_11/g.18  ORF Transcript_11/g.18 Transcript_11/m.18 type:complete len:164 (-) Transcript_11:64-555(-)